MAKDVCDLYRMAEIAQNIYFCCLLFLEMIHEIDILLRFKYSSRMSTHFCTMVYSNNNILLLVYFIVLVYLKYSNIATTSSFILSAIIAV